MSPTGKSSLPGNGAFGIGLDFDNAEAQDGDNHFKGGIGEVIMYSTELAPLDQQKVNSYLALKYGKTLDPSNPTDYLSSDGTIIWDAAENNGYTSSIFGIGSDNASGLNQKVSKSANPNSILTMALDANFTAANNDALRTTENTNDKQFLIVANNGGGITRQTTEIDATLFAARIGREWKVDKTANFTQNINLKFEGFDANWELMKDSDGDFSSGAISLGALDANGEISAINLEDGDYLTLHTNTATPTILTFTPKLAGNGETVTITGNGFTGTTAVNFGATAASSLTVVSGTEITAIVSAGASGAITVTNAQGNDSEVGFLYKVAQYNFESDVLDTTDNNHDGTEINTVTYQTGAQGQAVCFDNGPGYVKLPDNLIRNLSEFTISLRFKTTGTGSILGYQNAAPLTNAGNFIPILMLTDDGKLKGTLWTSANNPIMAVSTNPVNDGNWHQVDFTASSNTITIYLDGTVEATATGASVNHLDMSFNQLGLAKTDSYNNGVTDWEYFTGCLDDMVIIDKALTSQELEDNTALPEPTIASFTPTNVGEEDTVIITGTNFDGATQVTFGGEDALSYTVDSSTQITAIIENGTSGAIEVSTAGGMATATDFTFTSKTSITTSVSLLDKIIYCANAASAPISFAVSATDAYQDMVITAPTGFEVSLSENSDFTANLTVVPVANAIANTTIYVRVAARQNGRLSGIIAVSVGSVSENISITAATNNSLYFDGIDDYVELSGNNLQDGATAFTIEAWILPDISNYDGDYHSIFGKQSNGSPNLRNPSFYIIDGQVHVDSYEDNTNVRFDILTDDALIARNVWSHIALVKQGNIFTVYVNGVPEITTPAPNAVHMVGPYQIGFIDNYFAGKIDDVRFWNVSRTASEIADNIDTALTGTETGLVGYYNFNQGIANGSNTGLNTLTDRSPSAINGTLLNMTLSGSTSNWVQGYFPQISGNSIVYVSSQIQLSHLESGGIWASSDTNFAMVNQSGLVSGVALGTVDITYTICGQTTTKTITVINPPTFTVSETAMTISEDGGIGTFTVVLDTAPTSDVVFDISSNDANEANVDLAQLTFTTANWDTAQTVTVTGVDDNVVSDDSATITIAINDAASDDDFDALADQLVAITLTDVDDKAPILELTGDATLSTDTANCYYTVQGTELDPSTASDNSGSLTSLTYSLQKMAANPNLVSEDFNSGSWDTNNFELGTNTGSVVNGAYKSDTNSRGTLRTVSDFVPTVGSPLYVSATLSFGNGEGLAFFGTRSTGEQPGGNFNSEPQGLVFRIHNFNEGQTNISPGFDYQPRPGSAFYNDPVRFQIIDDGASIGVTMTNLVTNVFYTYSHNTTHTTGSNRIVFSGGSNVSWDDIKISLGAHETLQEFANGNDSMIGETLDVGEHTVTWTATDGSGNETIASQVVTINEDIKPIVLTQDITITLDINGQASILATAVDNRSTDNCGIDSLVLDKEDFTAVDTGDNTVTLTVTDLTGNVNTGTATITIINPDIDNDGVNNEIDNCPATANADQADNDSDGEGDICDIDDDNDGTPDLEDAFPTDANESVDTDGDGVGNNADAFPNDATESFDTDGDGTGDNADAFPNDANESVDSDGDGTGDNADAFPNDATESLDTDGDGVGNNSDAFPNDATESADTDGDGVGNNADVFPNDANESVDSDGDGTGDNADAFPNDANESVDTDGDGIGDTADADVDGDGTVDNGTDSDGDGINDANDTINDSPDTDGDGVPDAEDAFPNDLNESEDRDGDGVGSNADVDDNNSGIGEERSILSAEAFTPNGDGINDTWIIQGIENHPNAMVTVYNRNGHEVFKAIGYRNDWNGRSKSRSENLPSGSYYYVIDLRNGNAPIDGWLFINY